MNNPISGRLAIVICCDGLPNARALEKVLDLFIKAKKEEAERLQQNKNALLSIWQSIIMTDLTS